MLPIKVLSFVLLIVGLVAGYLIGYSTTSQKVFQQTNNANVEKLAQEMMADHKHTHNVGHEHMHMHEPFEVSEEQAPSVDLVVFKDAKDGWNLYLDTKNFKFTPGNVNKENIIGEGHAHLYIDGDKIGRIYSNWYHLPASWLEKGEHKIKIDLTTNDHKTYSVNGKEVSDEETIIVE
ncbi:hypothetical protein HRbin34_00583 [bacterium HR34]|nr:hypothetical protein HRbin34_00583 [bacterium HR34]